MDPDVVELAVIRRFRRELPGIYKKLLARAVRIVRAKRWTADGMTLPEGRQAADLAHEAIELVLCGTRRWDPEIDLLIFLTNVMRSCASHLLTGGSSREAGELESLERMGGAVDHRPSGDPEMGRRCEDLVNEAFAAAGADAVCGAIVNAAVEGYVKSNEIAEVAKLEPKVVYEGTRRLHRRIEAAAKRRKS